MYKTPILFLIFNRPDTTKEVFGRIKKIQPKYLFISSDGPRKNKTGEEELCLEARSIIQEIDWPCILKTLFHDENLGCAKGVSTAISWFFEHVEQGVILEDDCLPDVTFFSFCEELLAKFKYDKTVGAICGFNNQLGIPRTRYSYYFARLHSSWGWATWADRWQKYNEITNIPELNVLNKPVILELKEEIQDTFSCKIDSWAYRWQYVFQKNDFICIYPNVSLIQNIGFAKDASNTKEIRWWYKFIQYGKVHTLYHPSTKRICEDADRLTIQLHKDLQMGWKDRIIRKWYSWRKR